MSEQKSVPYTLDPHVQRDPRILSVYTEARRLYGKNKRCHHNFSHVIRNLHRALAIASEEEPVDYSVLIPSVLLHDIGFCDPDFNRLGHDIAGARLAQELLPDLGYEQQTIEAITHCIRAHKGKNEIPRTIEAKIVYDSDVLEKAGIVMLILWGKVACEFDESMEELLHRESTDRTAELKRGFYTRKARKLDGGRLKRVESLLSHIKREIEVERPDYRIRETDLWVNHPPEDIT